MLAFNGRLDFQGFPKLLLRKTGPVSLSIPALTHPRKPTNGILHLKTRWWQLKYFGIFTPKIGEMIHFEGHMFSFLGW